MSPSTVRRMFRILVPLAIVTAGCEDRIPGPTPRVVETKSTVGGTRTGSWTAPAPATFGTNYLPGGTRTERVPVVKTITLPARTMTFVGPAIAIPQGQNVGTGVPILEAILANPIKAETEYLNKMVRLQGLGTVGRDDRGYYLSFPTTAVAPGEVKPRPGLVAYIAKGEEGAFADLKRDATVTITATVRTWQVGVPETYRGVVIELDRARLVGVAHAGY